MKSNLIFLALIVLSSAVYSQVGLESIQEEGGVYLRLKSVTQFPSIPSTMNFGVDFINTSDRFVAPNVLRLQSDGQGNVTIGDTDATGTGVADARLTIQASNEDLMDLRLEGQGKISTQGSLSIYLDDNDNSSSESFVVRNSDNTSIMKISENNNHYILGNMAIGSTTNATGFKLSVDGKMAAEEVRVELSANWPDYVFKEDYPLMPLDQLKNQIISIGHLPGMPSAGEVEDSGISLGEMNRLLLEKIEELTLHAIQLNERISNLEKSENNE